MTKEMGVQNQQNKTTLAISSESEIGIRSSFDASVKDESKFEQGYPFMKPEVDKTNLYFHRT